MKIKAKKDMPFVYKGEVFCKEGDEWFEGDNLIVHKAISEWLNFLIEQEEMSEWIEIVEEKKEGRWKPSLDEEYWYLDEEGDVLNDPWEDDDYDNWRYSQGNCFQTEEEAEKHKRFLEFEGKLREIADGYEFTYDHDNYFVYFDHDEKVFLYMCYGCDQFIGNIYFPTEDLAEKACDMANAEYKGLFVKD